jgi:hypothetical protein
MKVAYTTVINISGGKKYFSFLPPHGIELDHLQSITYGGDILERLIPGWPYHSDKDRPPNRVKKTALEKAETDRQIKVIRSGSPVTHYHLTNAFRKISVLGIPDPYYSR